MKSNPFISILNVRDFRNLWLGQVVSQIAMNMLMFVLAIRVYRDTGSNTAVSVMLLSFSIPSILFGVLSGNVVDFIDRKKILVFCNFSRVLILILYFLFSDNLILLYILSVVVSVITQLFIPAEAPSIPNLVEKKLILTANSLFAVSFYLSSVTGYILAGPILVRTGHKYIYLLMSFFMLLATFFVSRLPVLNTINRDLKGLFSLSQFFKNINEGLVFIKNNARIRQSLILMTFSQSLITILAVLAPGFSDKVLNIDLNAASYLVLGPAAVGLIVGAFWVGQYGMRYLKGSLIITGILLSGLSLVAISSLFSGNLKVTLFFLIFLGVFNSFISVPANTILQEDSSDIYRGRVYGFLTSLTGGVSVLPVIFSGIFADFIGVRRTLLSLGIIVIFIGFYQLLQRKKVI